MCKLPTLIALLEVVVLKTCFPNTSKTVTVFSALAAVSMNKVPLETGFGYIFKPAIALFWLTPNKPASVVVIFNSSTVIVGVVVLLPCLNKNPPNSI